MCTRYHTPFLSHVQFAVFSPRSHVPEARRLRGTPITDHLRSRPLSFTEVCTVAIGPQRRHGKSESPNGTVRETGELKLKGSDTVLASHSPLGLKQIRARLGGRESCG